MKNIIILIALSILGGNVQMKAQDLLSGGTNSWIFHTPDDGRSTLFVAPKTNGNWDWATAFAFYNDGRSYFRNNIGIGTSNPTASLDIRTISSVGFDLRSTKSTDHWLARFSTNNLNWSGFWESGDDIDFYLRDNLGNVDVLLRPDANSYINVGNLGIGNTSPLGKLDISLGGWGNIPRVLFKQTSDNPSIRLYRPTGSSSGIYSWWIENTGNGGLNFKYGSGSTTGNETVTSKVTFSNNGYMGIGTTNPDEKLTVKGNIHTEEVRVDLNVPPDYVFQKYYTGESLLKEAYKMPTLQEVEDFTKKNHHLPEVPSAKEIKENGLNLKQMTALLLQKVEELTLYTIEQEKRIKKLEKELVEKKN